jgi:hypothetical protein
MATAKLTVSARAYLFGRSWIPAFAGMTGEGSAGITQEPGSAFRGRKALRPSGLGMNC